jgi:chitinase
VWEAGVDDYKVVKTLVGARYTRYDDFRSGASWLYSPTAGIFWTFDDPLVLAAKAAFVRAGGLGGVMFWELSGDTSNGELVTALADALR